MFEHHTELTYIGVITSYLLYGCNIALGKKDEAYANLQQAMVHAQRLRMHEEETYEGDPSDIYIRRFLYWLLVVSDRYLMAVVTALYLSDCIAECMRFEIFAQSHCLLRSTFQL
jgi:hypothetical protein